MSKSESDIREACESFLEEWDRHEWMQDNGEWASAQWEEERAEYEEALEALGKISDQPHSREAVLTEAGEALERLREAVKALDGALEPDESDYITEGTIDPDNIENAVTNLGVSDCWQGWDCQEGWGAYRHNNALYLNWWRSPYPNTNRHQRDLWVCVSDEFFEQDGEE
jgi:hypothetical protein